MGVSLCPPTYMLCAAQIAVFGQQLSSPQHQHANKGRLELYRAAKPTSAKSACAQYLASLCLLMSYCWNVQADVQLAGYKSAQVVQMCSTQEAFALVAKLSRVLVTVYQIGYSIPKYG